jgi:hypothetical protein
MATLILHFDQGSAQWRTPSQVKSFGPGHNLPLLAAYAPECRPAPPIHAEAIGNLARLFQYPIALTASRCDIRDIPQVQADHFRELSPDKIFSGVHFFTGG